MNFVSFSLDQGGSGRLVKLLVVGGVLLVAATVTAVVVVKVVRRRGESMASAVDTSTAPAQVDFSQYYAAR